MSFYEKVKEKISFRWKNYKLIRAVKKGTIDDVERLIQNGADVNARDLWGNTSLMVACRKKYDTCAMKLIDKGADINAKNIFGSTPLMEACWRRLEDVANKLIDKGANINAKDIFGYTPLINACRRGLEDVANKLVDKGANVNAKNIFGHTPLMEACRRRLEDVANKLIDKGANINARSRCIAGGRKSALINACFAGCANIANRLIDEGADINVSTIGGFTPLYIACYYRWELNDVAKKLIKKGATIKVKEIRIPFVLSYQMRRHNIKGILNRLTEKVNRERETTATYQEDIASISSFNNNRELLDKEVDVKTKEEDISSVSTFYDSDVEIVEESTSVKNKGKEILL